MVVYPDDEETVPFITKALKNRSLLTAYNAMENFNRASVSKTFHAWATNTGLSMAARNALFKALNVQTKQQFVKHMTRVSRWIGKSIGRRPYALVVEVGYVDFDNSTGSGREVAVFAKSSVWLGGPLVRALGRMPDAIIPVYDGHMLDYGRFYDLSHIAVIRAITKGIRDFVHVDDALYSGAQKAQLVSQFITHVADVKKTFEGKNRPMHGTHIPRLFVAAAYSTRTAMTAIKRDIATAATRAVRRGGSSNNNKKPGARVSLYASSKIPKPTFSNAVEAELAQKELSAGPTMTTMPFKVPNALSFGPKGLGNALSQARGRPLYGNHGFGYTQKPRGSK
jgi:hypothetical protein